MRQSREAKDTDTRREPDAGHPRAGTADGAPASQDSGRGSKGILGLGLMGAILGASPALAKAVSGKKEDEGGGDYTGPAIDWTTRGDTGLDDSEPIDYTANDASDDESGDGIGDPPTSQGATTDARPSGTRDEVPLVS